MELERSIKQRERTIEDFKKLCDFITVYWGMFAIQRFKSDKIKQYERMLYLMSVRHIANSHLYSNLCNQILELQHSQH